MAGNEQRRTRAKAWTAAIDAARKRAGFALPEGLTSAADRFRRLVPQWAVHADKPAGVTQREYNKIGMACFAAFGGSAEGFAAFDQWARNRSDRAFTA
jgi:Primase C terminal 2 (PriCT-2)